MLIKLIDNLDELDAIADEWRELKPPTPFQSPDWLIPWWQVHGDAHRELAVLTIRDRRGWLIGLCPWYVENASGGRRLRWLGDGAVCSDHASVLLAEHAPVETVQTIVAWIDEAGDLGWDGLKLEAVDGDNREIGSLVAGIAACGWLVTATSDTGSCRVSLPQNWDDYLGTVSKNHRKRCRRWQREYFESGRARVEIATTPEECRAAYAELVSLHNRRRQSTGSTGAFEDAKFRRFHELAIERLVQRGQVQLRLLTIDKQLAAIEYVLMDERELYAYQSGLSDAGAQLSAGNISVLALLRDAADSGRRRVDLLRGAESYKFSWGAEYRPAQTVVAWRPTWSGMLRACIDRALCHARSMRRRQRNSAPVARELVPTG